MTTPQRDPEGRTTVTNHLSPASSDARGSQAPLAGPSEQQSSHKRAPLSSDANDWFQAHRFIFRFEDLHGRRLTNRGLTFVRRYIGQFLRAQYGYQYPSTDSAQGNRSDTAVGPVDGDDNSQSRTQGNDSATT